MKQFFTKKNIAIISVALVILIAIITAGILLFTKESKAEYTISFNSDGGSIVTSITAFEGETVKLPENPTKEGYKFLYWADETEKPVSGDVIMERNLSLLAMWTEEDKEVVTVTFDTDGGTIIEPIVLEKGEKLVLPNNPTKEDYEFKEWVNSNNEKIVNEFFVEENITLKAIWTKKEVEKENNPKNEVKVESKPEVKNEEVVEQKPEVKEENKNIEVTEISLNSTDVSMVVNTSQTMKATVKPDNATNKTVKWTSTDSSVVTVDDNGLVKAVGLGTAIIKAETSNGKVAMASVTSEVKSMSLSADRSAVSYYGNKEAKLTLTIDANGYNVPDSLITWSIPDATGQNAPASSSASGRTATITARSTGLSGNISVTAKIGKKEAKKTIAVEQKLSVWTNSGNTITFSREENGRTYYTFKGEKVLDFGSNIDVTWDGFNSNSPVIANVDANNKRNLKLYVQYVAQNGLNVKARTAAGQVKEFVITPTL